MDKTSTELKHLKSDDQIVIPIEQWRAYQQQLLDIEVELHELQKTTEKAVHVMQAWVKAYEIVDDYYNSAATINPPTATELLRDMKTIVDSMVGKQ